MHALKLKELWAEETYAAVAILASIDYLFLEEKIALYVFKYCLILVDLFAHIYGH
jgi:hypothetical protein